MILGSSDPTGSLYSCIDRVLMTRLAFKTITISEEAYEKLSRLKTEDESFTDVILKLSEGRGNILRYAGAWKDMSREEADRLTSSLRELWGHWRIKKSA